MLTTRFALPQQLDYAWDSSYRLKPAVVRSVDEGFFDSFKQAFSAGREGRLSRQVTLLHVETGLASPQEKKKHNSENQFEPP